jgi:uncharacterized phage protein gp47/JayE
MPPFVKKNRLEILNQALDSVGKRTSITARSPGSVVRALTEALTTELGDVYDAMEYNISQSMVSTASGNALDRIGELYGVSRNTLSVSSAVSAETGSFYFYIDTPHFEDILIPARTKIYTSLDGFIGTQFYFETTSNVTLAAGQKRVFASVSASLGIVNKTAAPHTLTRHDATSPPGITLRCTNPKLIAPIKGYENDNDFRLRITKQIRVNASGTAEALRFGLLTLGNVREVMINSAPYGLGSVEIMVVPLEGEMTRTMLTRIRSQVDAMRPMGMRVIITTPDAVSFEVDVTVIVDVRLANSQKVNLAGRVEQEIKLYLNSLLPNESVVYNRLIQKVLDISDAVTDVIVTGYAADGIQVPRSNYKPKYNEQIIPGEINVSIV